MLKRVFVANRGEIAVRVIRAAHDLGIEAVAAFTEPDRESRHAAMADSSVALPGVRDYLDREGLVRAAVNAGCDAVHPGYGFLAEDERFATLCAASGLVFVGPTPETMRTVGDKLLARKLVSGAGISVLPGSPDIVRSENEAKVMADEIGYPLMIKAKAGGGGRGIRLVNDREQLVGVFQRASHEAEMSFADGELYLEKYLPAVRHVEVQIVADHAGQIVQLGERECTIQRRYQKMLEEAPAAFMSDDERRSLGELAIKAAAVFSYRSVGTVEFLYDVANRRFYFIEMNARIQVEHPTTEVVTGLDLVTMQLSIAGGRPLEFRQADVRMRGHAIECRITAEKPTRGFRPNPGTIGRYVPPGGPGIRVDDHCEAGTALTSHYDSLIAKVIAQGAGRPQAIARMKRALSEFQISGIETTIPFHLAVLGSAAFGDGAFDNRLVGELGFEG